MGVLHSEKNTKTRFPEADLWDVSASSTPSKMSASNKRFTTLGPAGSVQTHATPINVDGDIQGARHWTHVNYFLRLTQSDQCQTTTEWRCVTQPRRLAEQLKICRPSPSPPKTTACGVT